VKRRELFRRTFLAAIGAATTSSLPVVVNGHAHVARKFPDDYDASKDLARSDWKPVFLDPHQNETLIVLSELIIPTTDSPGAKAALVNRFIDRLLAAERPEVQRAFLDDLAYLDSECMTRYRSAFIHLSPEIQVRFLNFIAYPHTEGGGVSEFGGYAHFRKLKNWITRAYYNSEIGMTELGWDYAPFHGEFEGCAHPPGSHQ
jgi:hypothetical protein